MSSISYRPAIDGLRGIAVLAVFIFHLKPSYLPGGFVGVDVFFVISGYLITSIILKDSQAGNFSFLRFYQRRIARIFPAFFTVAIFTLFAASLIYSPQDYASAGANFTASALSVANLKLIFQGSYFDISPDAQPYLHCWSLSVEEQFYLLFPILFLLLLKFVKARTNKTILGLALLSLISCIVVTKLSPTWAFYLMPTRSWELLAGAWLAVAFPTKVQKLNTSRMQWASFAGLIVIISSIIFIHEGSGFPGWQAIFPVVGTMVLLWPPFPSSSLVEKLLSFKPLVIVGKISYSLYLWHWPIFSMIDYRFILETEGFRIISKISLSFGAAFLSYWLVERPARIFLNLQQSRRIAYGSLIVLLVICVPLGIGVRKRNYVNATPGDVAAGGIVFSQDKGARSVVLMGDSNASMYGKLIKEICSDLGYNLTVISVAAGDPLMLKGQPNKLWLDSLKTVDDLQPDFLILACNWMSKLEKQPTRLLDTIENLRPHSKKVIILDQPPTLPDNVNRAAIRDGLRPPFIENPVTRKRRIEANKSLLNMAGKNVRVLAISRAFEGNEDAEIKFFDESGRQLYHDESHLSGYGADLVEPIIREALLQLEF